MPLSYRNQSIDLQSKSVDWFLYDNGLRHERVKTPLILWPILVDEKVISRASSSLRAKSDGLLRNFFEIFV